MNVRLRRSRFASLILADRDRFDFAILKSVQHHARVGRDQLYEMLLAQNSGVCEIGMRARRLDEVAGILDDDIRFVAIAGQLGGNSREQIIDDADDPSRIAYRAVALPMRHLVARQSKNFRSGLVFVAGAERTGRDRVPNRGFVEGAGVGRMMLAAAERERETLPAQIDDVGDHAGDRIFHP